MSSEVAPQPEVHESRLFVTMPVILIVAVLLIGAPHLVEEVLRIGGNPTELAYREFALWSGVALIPVAALVDLVARSRSNGNQTAEG